MFFFTGLRTPNRPHHSHTVPVNRLKVAGVNTRNCGVERCPFQPGTEASLFCAVHEISTLSPSLPSLPSNIDFCCTLVHALPGSGIHLPSNMPLDFALLCRYLSSLKWDEDITTDGSPPLTDGCVNVQKVYYQGLADSQGRQHYSQGRQHFTDDASLTEFVAKLPADRMTIELQLWHSYTKSAPPSPPQGLFPIFWWLHS